MRDIKDINKFLKQLQAVTIKYCEVLGVHVLHWVKPIRQALPVFNEGYKAALESGELIYGGYISCLRLLTLFNCSHNLDLLLKETEEAISFNKNIQNQIAYFISIGFQLVLNNLNV